MMETVWEWGINLIVQFQTFQSWLIPMQVMTFTGNTEFFLMILPALYWLLDRRLGVRMATLLLLTILVGSILKVIGHGPRPYWISSDVQLLGGSEATFGLPSLHAMNAVVMWSLLAEYWHRVWGWVVALLLIIVAGVSRIYLGVHFPSDVLTGWIVGILMLGLWWRTWEPVGRWFQQLTGLQQLLLTTLLTIGLIVLAAFARTLTIATWDAAASWPGQTAQAVEYLSTGFSIADVVTAAGFMWGMVGGLLFCDRRGRRDIWTTAGAPLQRLGQYLVGVIGVLIIWQGLDMAFAPLALEESSVGYALRYVRYGLVGFWIFGLAPLFFIHLRLTQRIPAA